MHWVGTVNRHGCSGRQKGTICDARGLYPSIWSEFNWFVMLTTRINAYMYISRYGELTTTRPIIRPLAHARGIKSQDPARIWTSSLGYYHQSYTLLHQGPLAQLVKESVWLDIRRSWVQIPAGSWDFFSFHQLHFSLACYNKISLYQAYSNYSQLATEQFFVHTAKKLHCGYSLIMYCPHARQKLSAMDILPKCTRSSMDCATFQMIFCKFLFGTFKQTGQGTNTALSFCTD